MKTTYPSNPISNHQDWQNHIKITRIQTTIKLLKIELNNYGRLDK